MQCNISLTILKMEIENIWSQTNFSSAKHLVLYQCVLPHCALPGNGWYWEHMLVPSVRFEKLPWGEISYIVFPGTFKELLSLAGHKIFSMDVLDWFWRKNRTSIWPDRQTDTRTYKQTDRQTNWQSDSMTLGLQWRNQSAFSMVL